MPRRISARVASIGTPDDSRGTTIIAPSGMEATASSTEGAIKGITKTSRSPHPAEARGKAGISKDED
jgi:hypothetical protein